jgi:hypothetical protein
MLGGGRGGTGGKDGGKDEGNHRTERAAGAGRGGLPLV